MKFVTNFYNQAYKYQQLYKLSDEWLGFALGYCLFQPVIASSMIDELLDTARAEYTTLKESIDGDSEGKNIP